MGTIVPFADRGSIFDPEDIRAMSMALEDVCEAVHLSADAATAREIAARIVALATWGERNAITLRDRVLDDVASLPARTVDHSPWSCSVVSS